MNIYAGLDSGLLLTRRSRNTGDPSDVNCQAKCISVPNPDESAVNQTTECVAKCPQGDGTEEETQQYIDCSQKCVTDFFLTTTGGAAATQTSAAGSGSASATATPSATTVTSGSSTFVSTVTPSATSDDSASPTESSAESSDTPEGGAMTFAPLGSTGLVGLLVAFCK